jgi:hypothetical protein
MAVLVQHFCSICRGWQKPLHSLTPAVDWSDILIGPGGLLLVVGSELSQSLFHVYLCGLCPSVTTFSTDFSFQKLVFWNSFEF